MAGPRTIQSPPINTWQLTSSRRPPQPPTQSVTVNNVTNTSAQLPYYTSPGAGITIVDPGSSASPASPYGFLIEEQQTSVTTAKIGIINQAGSGAKTGGIDIINNGTTNGINITDTGGAGVFLNGFACTVQVDAPTTTYGINLISPGITKPINLLSNISSLFVPISGGINLMDDTAHGCTMEHISISGHTGNIDSQVFTGPNGVTIGSSGTSGIIIQANNSTITGSILIKTFSTAGALNLYQGSPGGLNFWNFATSGNGTLVREDEGSLYILETNSTGSLAVGCIDGTASTNAWFGTGSSFGFTAVNTSGTTFTPLQGVFCGSTYAGNASVGTGMFVGQNTSGPPATGAGTGMSIGANSIYTGCTMFVGGGLNVENGYYIFGNGDSRSSGSQALIVANNCAPQNFWQGTSATSGTGVTTGTIYSSGAIGGSDVVVYGGNNAYLVGGVIPSGSNQAYGEIAVGHFGFSSPNDRGYITLNGKGESGHPGCDITIGASTDYVGFYGVTPVVRAAHPATLSDVITLLTNIGICS